MVISQSVEDLNKNRGRRTTLTELDAQAPICDEGIMSECPVKPRKSSGFFKTPKKFF